MEETLIKFETAKLAKDKGFDVPTRIYYLTNGDLAESTIKTSNSYWADVEDYNTCCSQSLLQKWLREQHRIHIIVAHCPMGYKWSITYHTPFKSDFSAVETYELALETALVESLKTI